jgi:hypothetical protein
MTGAAGGGGVSSWTLEAGGVSISGRAHTGGGNFKRKGRQPMNVSKGENMPTDSTATLQ